MAMNLLKTLKEIMTSLDQLFHLGCKSVKVQMQICRLCKFENLNLCSSSHKNNTLKIPHF